MNVSLAKILVLTGAGLGAGAPAMAAYVTDTISSNFNGTAIAGTSYIWFNSHLTTVTKPTGSDPLTIYIRNAFADINDDGNAATLGPGEIVVPMPDADVTYTSAVSSPTVSIFGNKWTITVPFTQSGNVFTTGVAFDVPAAGIAGGANPVTFTADFGMNYAGASAVNLSWQWSAAVYSTFSTDESLLGVGIDSVPSNYTAYTVGGARGGGAANDTGSWSGTGTATLQFVPEPGALGLIAVAGLSMLFRRQRRV